MMFCLTTDGVWFVSTLKIMFSYAIRRLALCSFIILLISNESDVRKCRDKCSGHVCPLLVNKVSLQPSYKTIFLYDDFYKMLM